MIFVAGFKQILQRSTEFKRRYNLPTIRRIFGAKTNAVARVFHIFSGLNVNIHAF